MTYSITSAFSALIKNYVNLDPLISQNGKTSQNWLIEKQITHFPARDDKFPLLNDDFTLSFGSYSRKTKIRELDDIDTMIILHGEGATYYDDGVNIKLIPGNGDSRLRHYLDSEGNYINSRRVVNKFVSALSEVSQYGHADIKRMGEAATLKLSSYTWNFDIVPAFKTAPDHIGQTCYMIPDGYGHWKRTDPRIDKQRTSSINQKHAGTLLNIIRLTKYWKKKHGIPEIGSYLLETILLNYYDSTAPELRKTCLDWEFPHTLRALAQGVLHPVYDQKGFQGDINSLNWEARLKVYEQAMADASTADDAVRLEFLEPEHAGVLWQKVLGMQFRKDDKP
ncbi:nucleotidyltransferase [Rouxiella badensis]|uniref:nucleotidyltransferase n=1 Tax=Rouxiella badensis TaxID=1646377 RepID=UPI001D13562C|nr:nucleotidyltransferase [Rouxiella badensis]MCC3721510.1 nucleotidyltransferase [Rouxiella badensis]MCC3731040.1 nucleotidyltransferase [Rouxiella badensis]MCC3736005.1 nucleotidyltransferase [Rouxiella badensis]MCC3742616.1 nucleotidyltransferase [Rouxiella badensis]MCC3761402.1 nucleotidyltransferase [Rouxiella badensis]